MKGFPRSLRAALIVVIAMLASGCAASGYDAGALKNHLVATGVSREAATCVVDHMAPRFGIGRLGARAEPSTAELKAERALLSACGVKN